MCGPSAAQNTVQQSQIDLMNQVSSENATVFGESQGILNNLNATFAPILAAGPNAQGFSNAEATSMNTEEMESTASNFGAAKKALQEDQAAEGGGNNFIPSGEATSEKASLDATAAATLSNQQQQTLQANYATGRQNFMNAANQLQQTASTLNPVGTAGAATGAGSAAASTANTIAAQSNSVWTSVLGALGGVAGAAAGNLNVGPFGGG